MKKIGIVGGTAWLSTRDYYATICELGQRAGIYPEFSIESLDLSRALSYIGTFDDESSWQQFDAYYGNALVRVEESGAQVAILAANAPHHRFEAIARDVSIPVINIFDAVAEACATIGLTRLLVLGTALIMSSSVMRERFALAGITIITPPEDERARVVELIDAYQAGRAPDTAQAAQAIGQMAQEWLPDRRGAAVALACTELPLAFPAERHLPIFEAAGVQYINTLAVHANAVFDYARFG